MSADELTAARAEIAMLTEALAAEQARNADREVARHAALDAMGVPPLAEASDLLLARIRWLSTRWTNERIKRRAADAVLAGVAVWAVTSKSPVSAEVTDILRRHLRAP